MVEKSVQGDRKKESGAEEVFIVISRALRKAV